MAAGYLVAIIRKRRNLDSSPSGDVYRRAYLYGGYQRTGSGSDPYFGVGIGVNASDSVKVTGEFNFVAAELRKVTLAVVGQAILPAAAFEAAFPGLFQMQSTGLTPVFLIILYHHSGVVVRRGGPRPLISERTQSQKRTVVRILASDSLVTLPEILD